MRCSNRRRSAEEPIYRARKTAHEARREDHRSPLDPRVYLARPDRDESALADSVPTEKPELEDDNKVSRGSDNTALIRHWP